MKYTKKLLGLAALAATATTASAEKLTGTLALDFNSHFISYGADVWSDGSDPDLTFNPMLAFDYAATDALTLTAGIWLDVNHGNVDGAGGGVQVQETDIWLGASYDLGFGGVSVTWQNWQYAGETEEVLDIGFSLNTILSPSITIHQRLGGVGGQQEGTFIVFGIGHDFAVSDAFSIGLSSSIGVTPSEDYHGGDSGFGFATLGASASYSLSDAVSVYGGVTFYMTDDEVIPNNPEEDFVTFNLGTSYSF